MRCVVEGVLLRDLDLHEPGYTDSSESLSCSLGSCDTSSLGKTACLVKSRDATQLATSRGYGMMVAAIVNELAHVLIMACRMLAIFHRLFWLFCNQQC